MPPDLVALFAELDQKEAEVRRVRAAKDMDALDNFKHFCLNYVVTEYTDPETEVTTLRPYPDYPYLDEITAAASLPGLLVIEKSRDMIVTTHLLNLFLHDAVRVWRGRMAICRSAVIRQSEPDAEKLIKRVRDIWLRLPGGIRPPLTRNVSNCLQFDGGAEIWALNKEGNAGRGETWHRVVLDEGAFQDRLAENIGAFAPRARTMIIPSTVNGQGNDFDRVVVGSDYPGRRVLSLLHEVHPFRRTGTPEGDAYLALMRSKMSKADFLREIKMQKDVYQQAGYYSTDWQPAVVRPVEWDGKAPIIIGMDYSPAHPAAMTCTINEFRQFCYLSERLEGRTVGGNPVALDVFCNNLFGELVRRYPTAREWWIAPDPFRGRQSRSDSDDFGNPATDLATITRIARSIFGPRAVVSITQIGKMLRREGHNRVRRGFALREDGRYGIVVHPDCKMLIQGFSGGYGPKDNASADDLRNEEPDHSRVFMDIMDAARYAYCEFVKADRGVEFRQPTDSRMAARSGILESRNLIRQRSARSWSR